MLWSSMLGTTLGFRATFQPLQDGFSRPDGRDKHFTVKQACAVFAGTGHMLVYVNVQHHSELVFKPVPLDRGEPDLNGLCLTCPLVFDDLVGRLRPHCGDDMA